MFPPPVSSMNLEALSGILGSISIACWVVVFSPQIIENFRRGSADGLSLLFLIVWLAGDVFNILGAVLQGVLPTMTILAVYYTLADIVLLGQCFYYRGFSLSEDIGPVDGWKASGDANVEEANEPTEQSTLLGSSHDSSGHTNSGYSLLSTISPSEQLPCTDGRDRRRSMSSFRERFASVDGTHLSPATPFIDPRPLPPSESGAGNLRRPSALQTSLFNSVTVVLVCTAGVLGWYVSSRVSNRAGERSSEHNEAPLSFDVLGQIFGYLCAALYLGSRLPQLLLNFRRKSTEGVSLLFFLFACIGNLTYVLSIFAYSPRCADARCQPGEMSSLYGRYILVNLSWLLGSLGTLLLDMAIFVQFFLYRKD